VGGIGHHNHRAVAGGNGERFAQQWHEGQVDEHDLGFGMIEDPADIGGVEAGIDGVADGADAGDGVVEFDMAEGVPGQRRDPVAAADAETDQGFGQAASACRHFPPGAAGDPGLDGAGDHLAVAVDRLGVSEQP
jgi:hypothetical protein